MGSLTDFAENEMLDHVINDLAFTSPAGVFLGLSTSDPTDAATGASANEAANSFGYARTAISFGVAATRAVDQDAIVTFPAASGGSWGTITHWAIFTSATYGAGDCLAHGAFGSSKLINDGDTPSVASGEIDVTFSANEISNFLALEILDHLFNNATYTYVATWVAMIITTPVTDGMTGSTITEPSGGAYARKQVNKNGGSSPTWDLAAGTTPTQIDNTHSVDFVTATASWGTIIAVALVDASSAGNLLMYDNTMTDKLVDDGDTAKFAVGVLDVELA